MSAAPRATARAVASLLSRFPSAGPSCRSAAAAWTAPASACSGSGRWPAAVFSSSSSSRGFASSASPAEDALPAGASERVTKVATDILALNLLEVAELTELLQDKLGVSGMPAFGGGFGGVGGAPAAGPAGGGGGAAAAAAAPVEEQTEFSVKLEGYEAGEKLKVIKELRGATGLGLKESKDLAEKHPVVVKTGMKKEEAEALKALLEGVGAKVSLE